VKKRQTAEAMLEQGADKVYSGPVKKQSGVIAVAAGETLDDDCLWSMDYFVEGVIGTMPKSE
jgi:hypothetical protein